MNAEEEEAPGIKGRVRPGRRKKEGGGTIPDCGGALPGQELPGNDRGCVQLQTETINPNNCRRVSAGLSSQS